MKYNLDDARLLKALTPLMEEHGLPKFQDDYPARDVLQLFKDSGYSSPAFATILLMEIDTYRMEILRLGGSLSKKEFGKIKPKGSK